MGKNNSEFDVAIIGGGISGLCTSIQLAQNGISVVVFEKEKYPFHRVCGEYVSMESFDFLNRIGIGFTDYNLPRINTVKISSINGNIVESELNPGGFGISRYLLDNLLAEKAKALGVIVMEETKVTEYHKSGNHYIILSNKGTFRSNIVIGAFGKRSNMDFKLNREFIQKLKNSDGYVAIKYHVRANLPDNLIQLHNFKGGYCGISKVEGEKYCLCYLSKVKNLTGNKDVDSLEKEILMKNPFLENYLSNFEKIYSKPIAISQLYFGNKQTSESGIPMIGDAAGVIAPLTGNGMSMAMHGSLLLSRLILSHISGNISESELITSYQQQWNALFKKRIQFNVRLQNLILANNFINNTTVIFLKVFPPALSYLIKKTLGKSF